jgi:hypothetical protein
LWNKPFINTLLISSFTLNVKMSLDK